ncbi:MAG: CZB domain-containing protein [Ignavibacteriae bacterium]|nr:CZB domain-containing protein [Ignavibacteriota bacterium]
MVTKEAIEAALAAHAQWKKRLQDAITTGQSEFKPDAVKKDNACQFGQWLYGLPQQDTASEDFKKVKMLHAEFHKIAGEILMLALSGKKENAMKMLGFGGSYGTATGKLVLALQSWKGKI